VSFGTDAGRGPAPSAGFGDGPVLAVLENPAEVAILKLMSTSQGTKLAVIGTAGRGDDAPRINRALYVKMAVALKQVLVQVGPISRLVSGGAAVADHLAVGFFLRDLVPALSLHLPASYSRAAREYVEPYPKSAGSISNYWHREFSRKCGGNSLNSIYEALSKPGCSHKIYMGFDLRNAGIAEEADAAVAFTFGADAALKPGGTWGTMEQCLRREIPTYHVDLHTMKIYSPAGSSPVGR
jgi:hypothetical protein